MNINFKEIKIKVINYYQNDQNKVKNKYSKIQKKIISDFYFVLI